MKASICALIAACLLHILSSPLTAAPTRIDSVATTAAISEQNPRLLVNPDGGRGSFSFEGAAFSPDGVTVVLWGYQSPDPNIKNSKARGPLELWDVQTGQRLQVFHGHADQIRRVQFSPDGKQLASQSQDGLIALWDVATGRLIHTLVAAGSTFDPGMTEQQKRSLVERPNLLGFSADSRQILLAAQVYNPRTAKTSASAKPTAARLTRWLQAYDVATAKLVHGVALPSSVGLDDNSSFDLAPNAGSVIGLRAERYVTTSDFYQVENPRVEIHDVAAGALQKSWALEGESYFSVSALSPDGRCAALHTSPKDRTPPLNYTLTLLNVTDGKTLGTWSGDQDSFHAVAFSHDNARIATNTKSGSIEIYNIAEHRLERTLSGGHCGDISALAWAPDDRKLVSVGGLVQIWDLTAPLYPTAPELLIAQDWNTRTLEIGDDGQMWSTSYTRTSNPDEGINRLEKGQSLNITRAHLRGATETIKIPESRLIGQTAFSPDHKLVAAALGTEAQPSSITGAGAAVWDIASKKLLFDIRGSRFMMHALAFSPDQSTLAVGGGDGTLSLWDVKNGKLLREFAKADSAVSSLVFSPDGRTLLSGTAGGTISLFDVASGQLQRRFADDPSVETLCFSPDGKLLVTAGTLRIGEEYTVMVRLWDVESGDVVREYSAPKRVFNGLSFSPDGHLLAIASFVDMDRRLDHQIEVWDIANQKLAATLHDVCGLDKPLFTPDGRHLLAQSGGWLKQWNLQNILATK